MFQVKIRVLTVGGPDLGWQVTLLKQLKNKTNLIGNGEKPFLFCLIHLSYDNCHLAIILTTF